MTALADLEDLRTKANAASSGSWTARRYDYDGPHVADGTWFVATDGTSCIADDLSATDAAYIAACCPTVILALLDRLAKAEATLADKAAARTKASEPNGIDKVMRAAALDAAKRVNWMREPAARVRAKQEPSP